MNPSIETFNALVSEIVQQIQIVEQYSHTDGAEAARRRYEAEEKLYYLLNYLKHFALDVGIFPHMQSIITALEERIERLPYGASFPVVREVQSLLEFPNLGVLVAEERPSNMPGLPELVRLVVTDRAGYVLFDRELPALQAISLSFVSQQGTVLSSADKEAIVAMKALWPDLLSVVRGRFLLSESLLLTQTQLMVTAQRYDLEVPVVIGESVLTLCQRYLTKPTLVPGEAQETSLPTDLPAVIEAFGIPLSGLPHPGALDRAGTILQLLAAMAQGVIPQIHARESEEHGDQNDINHY
jgi:hypothetical protein